MRVESATGELAGLNIQFGGQTPLKLAAELEAAGVPILGTPPDAIDLAEDRDRFRTLLGELGLKTAGQRDLHLSRGRRPPGQRYRLSGGGAPVLCAWWAGDGNHP